MKLLRLPLGVKVPAAVMVAAVLALALTGGVLAAKGAISNASIPNNGTIHACYVPHKNAGEKQGKLRLVSDEPKCKKNEEHISWSVAGGLGGEKGDTGDTGPQGPGVEPTPPSVVLLRGAVTGRTMGTTGTVTEIVFQLVLDTGEPPVDLTPGTAKVRYEDSGQSIISTTLTRFKPDPVMGVTGSPTDSDLFLEPGEIFEITLLDLELEPDLGGNTDFTIDVISEFGTVLSFEAATPVSLPEESIIDLPVSP